MSWRERVTEVFGAGPGETFLVKSETPCFDACDFTSLDVIDMPHASRIYYGIVPVEDPP